jgi:molecular chaperone DnaK (HSP70)
MTSVVGIDLGTTYSVVATLNERGTPQVLRNPLGDETTPSVVCFESPTSVLVGKAARNAALVYPDRTVSLVKRRMGTGATYTFHGVEHTPESISALILRALVDGAAPRRSTGEPVSAVITVPAYFGIREREATKAAAMLAEIDVLELISEPVAAAIHYGFAEDVGIGTALIYDLGGGTFDTTVLTLGRRIDVVATDGDVELGGADWDERLATHLLSQFEPGLDHRDPGDDPADDEQFMNELTLAAERAKRELSTATSHRTSMRWRGHAATVSVHRSEFESMSRDLLDRTLAIVERVVQAARGKGVASIDRCLLVGGSTHMPAVAAAMEQRFGWPPRRYDPDLAVAKGAALRAHQLVKLAVAEQASPPGGSSDRRGRSAAAVQWHGPDAAPGSTDVARPAAAAGVGRSAAAAGVGRSAARGLAASVAPRALGLLIDDSGDGTANRRFVQHVIHANAPLPAAGAVRVATIVDDQRSVRLRVYEQAGSVESAELEANRLVLDGQVSGLPPLKGGSPLEVRLDLDGDGRLLVVVTEPRSGARLDLEAYIDGVVDRDERVAASDRLALLTVRQ